MLLSLVFYCGTLLLLSCVGAEDSYHYPRPHVPFHLSPQPQPPQHQREPPKRYIVQTLGPHGRTYELQTHKAPAIYVAHETVTLPGNHFQQQQQQQHHHQQHHQQHHHHHQQQQQLHTSAFTNPLLVNANYQQQQQPLSLPPPAPAAQPLSYYGQPQTQTYTQQPQGPPPAAHNYYNPPQALSVATATQSQSKLQLQSQSAGHYYGQLQDNSGSPQSAHPSQPPQSPHYSNPQPYAVVTLPSGQRVQDAGHGSGPAPSATGHGASAPPRIGDYSAQSQTATLDTYNYKQSVAGDARAYQRFVTKCQPNGQCQQISLNPGQIDGDHQQLLQTARAQTQPAISDCHKSNQVPPGAQLNAQGQLRPKGRRSFGYVQEQLDKYPYN